jgi:hypothetical protein
VGDFGEVESVLMVLYTRSRIYLVATLDFG